MSQDDHSTPTRAHPAPTDTQQPDHCPHLPRLSLVRLHELPGILRGPGLLQLGGAGVVPAHIPAVGGGAAELPGEARHMDMGVPQMKALGRAGGLPPSTRPRSLL